MRANRGSNQNDLTNEEQKGKPGVESESRLALCFPPFKRAVFLGIVSLLIFFSMLNYISCQGHLEWFGFPNALTIFEAPFYSLKLLFDSLTFEESFSSLNDSHFNYFFLMIFWVFSMTFWFSVLAVVTILVWPTSLCKKMKS